MSIIDQDDKLQLKIAKANFTTNFKKVSNMFLCLIGVLFIATACLSFVVETFTGTENKIMLIILVATEFLAFAFTASFSFMLLYQLRKYYHLVFPPRNQNETHQNSFMTLDDLREIQVFRYNNILPKTRKVAFLSLGILILYVINIITLYFQPGTPFVNLLIVIYLVPLSILFFKAYILIAAAFYLKWIDNYYYNVFLYVLGSMVFLRVYAELAEFLVVITAGLVLSGATFILYFLILSVVLPNRISKYVFEDISLINKPIKSYKKKPKKLKKVKDDEHTIPQRLKLWYHLNSVGGTVIYAFSGFAYLGWVSDSSDKFALWMINAINITNIVLAYLAIISALVVGIIFIIKIFQSKRLDDFLHRFKSNSAIHM